MCARRVSTYPGFSLLPLFLRLSYELPEHSWLGHTVKRARFRRSGRAPCPHFIERFRPLLSSYASDGATRGENRVRSAIKYERESLTFSREGVGGPGSATL